MQTLNSLILRFSQSWPLFLMAAVVTFGSIYIFTGVIEPRFRLQTAGAPPFDLQNSLTVDQVDTQLAAYTAEARRLYYVFAAIDFVFPLFASLFLASIAAFSLRYLWPSGYQWTTEHRLWVLLLLPTLFDWLENVFALTIITAHGRELRGVAALMIYAKLGKLSLTAVAQVLAWGLLVMALVKWLVVRIRAAASG